MENFGLGNFEEERKNNKAGKKMQEPQEIEDVPTAKSIEKEENANDEEATREANAKLEGLASLLKELQSFKQDMRKDLGEFKNDVKKTMKQDLAEFKDNVLKELQNQC